jgi:hypothetical protein
MGRLSKGEKVMKVYHKIDNLSFSKDRLKITIDGKERIFLLKDISPILARSSATERNNYEISPSGYGIHWPLLDEDLSIDGLLGITHTPESKIRSA